VACAVPSQDSVARDGSRTEGPVPVWREITRWVAALEVDAQPTHTAAIATPRTTASTRNTIHRIPANRP